MSANQKPSIISPDCMTYPCQQECCSHGCDVWPHEHDALLAKGLAQPSEFGEHYQDDEGDWLYRTALGPRGCTFLNDTRGCRLHPTGMKPEVCIAVPRSADEADEMESHGMMPCRADWKFETADTHLA